MSKDNYFIKDGYKCNPVKTFDDDPSDSYWTADLIKATKHWQMPVYEYAATYAQKHSVKTLIDVGCGAAVKLKHFHRKCPAVRVVGIDQNSAIRWNRKNLNFGEWIEADLSKSYTSSTKIEGDLVLCCDVIEHVEKPEVLMETLRKLTSVNGRIIISTPDRYVLRGPHSFRPDNVYHVREWNAEEFCAFIKSEGFEIEEHQHLFPKDLGFHRGALDFIIKPWIKGRPFKFSQLLVIKNCK